MVSIGARYAVPFTTAFDTVGVVSPGAQLFFYISGTSTPSNTYSDSGLVTPNSNPVVANAAGLFGNIFLNPAVTYKVTLETFTGDLIWTADPVVGNQIVGTYSFATTAALLAAFSSGQSIANGAIAQTAGRTAEGDNGGGEFYYNASDTTTADNGGTIRVDGAGRRWYWIGTEVFPELFGAKGDGTTDDIGAFTSALTYLSGLTNGGRLYLRATAYATSTSIVLSTSNLSLVGKGSGATSIIPLTDSQVCVRIAASNCQVTGLKIINSNNKATTRGLVLGPASVVTLTTNNNLVTDLYYEKLQYGRVMSPGATPSQCYFNNFFGEELQDCVVGILYDNPASAGNGGANANNTFGISIWSGSTVCNAGIIIKAGTNNNFYGGYIEGMVNAGILATATAIQVIHTSSDGADNNSNKFYGIGGETNTIGFDNKNPLTQIYGGNLSTGANTWTATPAVLICDDPSEQPLVVPGMTYQTNGSLPALPNNVSIFPGSAQASGYFATATGAVLAVLNGGTFTIAIPSINTIYDLYIVDTVNENQPYASFFSTNGVGATTFTVLAAGNVTVTGNLLVVTVTNSSGSTGNFKWAIMQRTA